MGGMNGGSTASSLAVQTIINIVSSSSPSSNPVEVIRNAIEEANSAVFHTGQTTPNLFGMGTTLTLLLINNDCAYVSHIGDSRVYQLRAGRKVFRTFDDSVVFQLVKSGAITEEEARVAGNSNVITKALGINESVDFEVRQLPYDRKDRFLLCTDGFWGTIPEEHLLSFVGQKDALSIVLERAFNKVENAGKETHPNHYDNLTAAFIEVNRQSKLRSSMEKKYKLLSYSLALILGVCLCILGISHFRSDPINKAIKFHHEAVKAQKNADSLQAVLGKLEASIINNKEALAKIDSSDVDGLKKREKSLKEIEEEAKDAKTKLDNAVTQANRAKEKASKAIDKVNDLISDLGCLIIDNENE